MSSSFAFGTRGVPGFWTASPASAAGAAAYPASAIALTISSVDTIDDGKTTSAYPSSRFTEVSPTPSRSATAFPMVEAQPAQVIPSMAIRTVAGDSPPGRTRARRGRGARAYDELEKSGGIPVSWTDTFQDDVSNITIGGLFGCRRWGDNRGKGDHPGHPRGGAEAPDLRRTQERVA